MPDLTEPLQQAAEGLAPDLTCPDTLLARQSCFRTAAPRFQPAAVSEAPHHALSTTDVSLHLTDYKDDSSASQTSPRVAEDVEQIRSLDVAALLANLVGSIQVRRKMSG